MNGFNYTYIFDIDLAIVVHAYKDGNGQKQSNYFGAMFIYFHNKFQLAFSFIFAVCFYYFLIKFTIEMI